LLGFSEQARSHYRAGPARMSGQDLMRGEHVVGEASKAFKSQGREAALQKTGNSSINSVFGPPEDAGHAESQTGTSIFDPVLCELVYRWFCPEAGAVLDPFAGGSVRGIMASLLGRTYTGVELSAPQIAANQEQAAAITPDAPPTWIEGDSISIGDLAPGMYDLIFSCPPYADLEVYSDHPADLSTMQYPAFIEAYRAIIAASVAMLKRNRFACFVVGDVRDSKGFYRNFVSDTIAAFEDAGAELYNEAILVTAVGSLPIRAGRAFQSGRKLGKTHQNVLVFYKGDPARIKQEFGEVEMGDPAGYSAEEAGNGD
jgi:DNA modification methylase